MKRKILIEKLQGEDGLASLYVFTLDGESDSEYIKYWNKFESAEDLIWEFDVIDQRITKIVENGAEDEHFRKEGKAVKALPIDANSKLRLYCYRVDVGVLILGNGGIKLRNLDPTKNKTKDFPELYDYCETIRKVGLEIEKRIDSGEIEKTGNDLMDGEPFVIEIEYE